MNYKENYEYTEKRKLILSMIKFYFTFIVSIIFICLDIFYLILLLNEILKDKNALIFLIESKYLYYWSLGFIFIFVPILCDETNPFISLLLKLGLFLTLLIPAYYIVS